MLLAADVAGVPAIVCTLLLIATVITFILAVCEVLGVYRISGTRFGVLIGFIIFLVLYIVLC